MPMNHQQAGINKGVSESVYPKDILSDTAFQMCGLKAKGAWLQSLLYMWHDQTDSIKGTCHQLGLLWGCSEDEARDAITELRDNNVCDVTPCHKIVTLMSRRLNRRLQRRKGNTDRQKRKRSASDDNLSRSCHTHVPSEKGLSSSSSSISNNKECKIATTKEDNPTWLTPFMDLWNTHIGEFPFSKAARPLRDLVNKYPAKEVLAAFARYVKQPEKKFLSAANFKERYLTWSKPPKKRRDAI